MYFTEFAEVKLFGEEYKEDNKYTKVYLHVQYIQYSPGSVQSFTVCSKTFSKRCDLKVCLNVACNEVSCSQPVV